MGGDLEGEWMVAAVALLFSRSGFLSFGIMRLCCWLNTQCGTDPSMCQYSILVYEIFIYLDVFTSMASGQSLSLSPYGPVPVVLYSCIVIRKYGRM